MTAPRLDTPAGPRMTAPIREYSDLIGEEFGNGDQALKQSALVASKRDPDRWAKVLTLSQRLKLPADLVDRQFDTLDQADKRKRSEYSDIIQTTPGLQAWLKNPDNATLGRDEVASLAKVDQNTQTVSQGGLLGAVETGYNELTAAAGNFAAVFGMGDPVTTARSVAQANKRAGELRAQMPDYFKEFTAAMEAHGGDVNKASRAWLASQEENGRTDIQRSLDSFKTGAVSLGEMLSMVGAAARRPRGLLYQVVQGFVPSAPMLVGAIGGAAVGSVPGLVGGTLIGGVLPSVGAELNAELEKAGVDITDPEALARAYQDPAFMAPLREKAARKGVTVSMVNALLAPLAGKFLAAAGPEAGLATKAVASAADISVQAGGVGAGTLAAQKAGGEKLDVGQAIQATIATLGYAVGAEVLGASRRGLFHADPAKAAVEATAQASDAMRAQRDAQALQEIGTAVTEAKTTQQVPERLKSLVELAAGGDENAQVYFQLKDWDEHFQSRGTSPAKAVADIMGDDGKAYYEAKAAGGALAIPLSDYVAKVATTDSWEPLLPAARTKLDGMSLLEANEYLQSLPATMAEIANEKPPTVKAPKSTIRVRIEKQLIEAGRSKSEAKAAAQVYEAAFHTLAERAGMDPQVLFHRYSPEINPEAPVRNAKIGTPPPGIEERRAITAENIAARQKHDLAKQAYDEAAQAIRNFPDERRQMLIDAFRKPSDILDLKQEARGRFRINPQSRQVVIDLFRAADRSTFVHEAGHHFLEVLGDLAKTEVAVPQIAEDYASVRQWVKAEGDKPFTREQHEQFARGFESYLMEGKAPSQSLRDVFYRFKRWLMRIYKHADSLGAELTPEIRKVFDRLLAVDEEIARAEENPASRPLFDDPKAMGMNDEQVTSYAKAIDEAHQAAEEVLTVRLMKQIKKEESAEWAAWRDPIEKEVAAEVDQRPDVRAFSFLKSGTNPDGTPSSEPQFKLSRQAVKETYGVDAAAALPRGVTGKDGIHPDLVAEHFGYRSGKELVEALSKTTPRDQLIKQVTDARMQLEHGERLTELQIKDEASEALQNEKRSQLLRKELEFLASDNLATLKGLVRKVTRIIPPTEAIRVEAEKIVGSKSVRDLKPFMYEKAAQKLAVDAKEALLRGDVETAFDLKRKEILTNELFRTASDAKAQIEKSMDEFKKVFRRDEKLSKTRDMDLVNAARAILASFGIGKSDQPASAYLEQMRRYDPEVYETVQAMVTEATAQASPYSDYRSLTVDDFTALRETVASLWELSRRNRQIEIDGQKLDRAQVQEELSARITAIGTPDEKPGYTKAVTNWEKTQRSLMTGRSWLRRVEHWADAMDQGNPGGPFRKYIWNPISEGVATYRIAKRATLEKYLEIVKPVEKAIKTGTIEAPELGYTFEGKAELLGALLHSGNESNLSKMLRGRAWGTVDERGVLDASRWEAFTRRLQADGVLTKADYDYAQGVWDLFEELKVGAQKAHNEMYGHHFAEITAKEFDTLFGKYKGGYVPAKADPFLVPDAQIKRESESLTSGADNSFMFPTTGRGFTKSRVEAYARPLIMNAAFVPSQLDAVLRFTHIEPRVKDVGRIVVNRSFRNTLDGFDPTVGGEMLVPWLQRAAQQRVDLPGKFPMLDRFFKGLRTRTGLQIMTANVVNSLQQFTGLSISMTKVEPGRLASALWAHVRDPKGTAAAVAEKSPFMRTRMTATVMEVQKTIDNIMLDPSKYDKLRAFTTEHGYFLASGTQSIVDHITWMGKYDEAVAKGASDRDAVRQADSAVRETQGSFAPEDVSRAEAQTPFVRAFLQFYGYFNMQANLLGTEFLNTQRTLGLRKGAGKLLFAYTVGFAIPAILSDALTKAASSRPFDQDHDGPVDDVFDLFFGSQLRTASRFVPVVGQLSDAAIGAFTKAKYDDSIRLSPAVSSLERALSVPADAYHAIRDKQLTNKHILDFLTAVGLMTGLPTAPIAKPINFLRDVKSGKAQPKNSYEFGRGLVTGR